MQKTADVPTPKDLHARENNEHPFAPYVRILGKGKKGSRSLTDAEAEDAMGMILRGETLDLQLGAFLMLLRVKEETPDELAGFVRAAKATFMVSEGMPANLAGNLRVDIDWSSYAGKRRHLPWFLLALKVLAGQGYRIYIHGTEGHTLGRIYTRELAGMVGIPVCENWASVAGALSAGNIAYMPLAALSPPLERIIQMRSLLGLRSPVHSMARLLNPLNAPLVMQGIFHPPYAPLHQAAGAKLGYQTTLVIKGDGGEIERNPDAACQLFLSENGVESTEEWPAIYGQRHLKGEDLSAAYLLDVWNGAIQDSYANGAITGTIALALRGMNVHSDAEKAHEAATRLWHQRPKTAADACNR
jgi:anthranilate phosphoribosyltransferase